MRIAASCLMFLLCGAASAEELSGRELRSTFVGQSIQWWENGGWKSGGLTLLPDGRAEISLSGPARAEEDIGRWHIEGNHICTSWARLRAQQTKCYSVNRIGPNRFVTSGGNVFEIVFAGV